MWIYATWVWRRWFKPGTVSIFLVASAVAVFSTFAALTASSDGLTPSATRREQRRMSDYLRKWYNVRLRSTEHD